MVIVMCGMLVICGIVIVEMCSMVVWCGVVEVDGDCGGGDMCYASNSGDV